MHECAFTDEVVEELYDKLLMEAYLKDYFDRQTYSTAACLNCILLTGDQQLHDIARSQIAPRPRSMMRWSEVRRSEKKSEQLG
jgi:hypothetical protein